MPYKDSEKQAEYMRKYRTPYMRDYRKHKNEESTKESMKKTFDLAQAIQIQAQFRHQWEEMLKIIGSISFILNRTDLTEHEKIVRISEVPIPNDLAPYFRKQFEEVTT